MELRTKRLLLRPLCLDDALGVQRGLNNFNVTQFLARPPYPYTLAMAEDFIAKQDDATDDFVRAICFACAPGEVLGVIAYGRTVDGCYDLGYWLRECCWGLGIMSEAAEAMVTHYMLNQPGQNLLSGFWNPNSGRLLKRLGFVETGLSTIHSVSLGRNVEVMQMELQARASPRLSNASQASSGVSA